MRRIKAEADITMSTLDLELWSQSRIKISCNYIQGDVKDYMIRAIARRFYSRFAFRDTSSGALSYIEMLKIKLVLGEDI